MFNIIPQPVEIKVINNKTNFELSDKTNISDFSFSDDLIKFIEKVFNINISKSENADIILKLDNEFQNDEGYFLKCENSVITITAKTENGLFYGIQTLKQLLFQGNGKLPLIEITDYPRFSYRGYMLDCGRYFYTVEEIKRIIDLIALHKFNIFHWHLTEDQGWRIEIKKHPLLTEKGSKRTHTNFNHTPHSGFYTQEEVKEIVKYCHSKKIKVIPEFDIPGHNVSSIACYPYLSCFDRELEVATHWGVKRDILCAGKETTYKFVYDVLDEIMELFPDKIIHLGGDEAFKTRWKICKHCQQAIKDNNLKDEDDLQMLFMSKVNEYVSSKGFSAIMWSNDNKGGTDFLDPKITWTVYLPECNEELLNKELSRGRKLINTRNTAYYLDFPYGWTSLKDVYNDKVILTKNESDTIGVEGCMWTEYVPDMKKLEFLTFPRLAGISENGWSQKEGISYEAFLNKSRDYLQLLDLFNVQYAPMKKAMPSFIYKHASSLWFRRRVFHWQGLHVLFDDKKVEKIAKEK